MPTRHERTEKRKFVRVPGGTVRQRYVRKKTSKHKCALCRKVMHGMPHGKRSYEVRKLSKSQRRPTAVLAGVLCSECRTLAIEEAAKVKYGMKNIADVDFRIKKYVEQIMGRIE